MKSLRFETLESRRAMAVLDMEAVSIHGKTDDWIYVSGEIDGTRQLVRTDGETFETVGPVSTSVVWRPDAVITVLGDDVVSYDTTTGQPTVIASEPGARSFRNDTIYWLTVDPARYHDIDGRTWQHGIETWPVHMDNEAIYAADSDNLFRCVDGCTRIGSSADIMSQSGSVFAFYDGQRITTSDGHVIGGRGDGAYGTDVDGLFIRLSGTTLTLVRDGQDVYGATLPVRPVNAAYVKPGNILAYAAGGRIFVIDQDGYLEITGQLPAGTQGHFLLEGYAVFDNRLLVMGREVLETQRQSWPWLTTPTHALFGTETGIEVLPIHAGDANYDGIFDSGDLVQLFRLGEYEDDIVGNSRWQTGDFNGDLEFDSADVVEAFQTGLYE